MAKTKLTMENISEFINALSYADFKALIESYTDHTKTNFDAEIKRLVTIDLENHPKLAASIPPVLNVILRALLRTGNSQAAFKNCCVKIANINSQALQERFSKKLAGIGMFGLKYLK